MPGVDCPGIYRRVAGDVAERSARFAGTDKYSRRRHELPNRLVDYRSGFIRRAHQFDKSAREVLVHVARRAVQSITCALDRLIILRGFGTRFSMAVEPPRKRH